MDMLWRGIGLANTAAIVIYFTAMMQPAMAQSTDGLRPGDLFSVDQVGQKTGQVLKNNGIYLDSAYLNDVLANVQGGNETGVTSAGEAFVAAHFDMNTITGIPNAAMHIIFDDRTGKNASTLAGTQFGLSGLNGPSDTIRLSEFSWDQMLFDDHLRLLVSHFRFRPGVVAPPSSQRCRLTYASVSTRMSRARTRLANTVSIGV